MCRILPAFLLGAHAFLAVVPGLVHRLRIRTSAMNGSWCMLIREAGSPAWCTQHAQTGVDLAIIRLSLGSIQVLEPGWG